LFVGANDFCVFIRGAAGSNATSHMVMSSVPRVGKSANQVVWVEKILVPKKHAAVQLLAVGTER
jgi:hypothetical protein